MNSRLSVMSSFGVFVCFTASALGQAGAPTQRVHIPGIPDRTSIYPKSMDRGHNFVSIGCVAKSPNGQFHITDWRVGKRPPVPHTPPLATRPPLISPLPHDQQRL